MANVAGQFSVPASTTLELFTEIGIDAGRVTVSLHTDSGSPPVVLCNASDGSGVSFALPDDEGAAFQFITDKDPVYLSNLSGAAITVCFYISAA